MTDLPTLYQELSDLTRPLCGKCKVPHGCCDAVMGCELTQSFAKDFYDVDLKPVDNPINGLIFMTPNGCVVAPHLRPHCTRHHCDINRTGGFEDPDITRQYFDLIERIQALEFELYNERKNSKESKE